MVLEIHPSSDDSGPTPSHEDPPLNVSNTP